ncbi:SMP-30/gluconolactonase/LRE family protein [Hydrogenophaga sp. BPS33]|uniref:SMP-30/gluconolactonase/LRE family protein n=1 Tax=Hydrogenophaga sp. BPS33 TaxID=2651974 RepID=UPI00131FA5A5|nr:SMP-30/gluconolactonase/LRE family protein [Hydrogenophaga sp. BPS33]QHE84738.1 SMP-30/gluconolactonase/LRE family protein [Hydrogenophaga sp. BPS33]
MTSSALQHAPLRVEVICEGLSFPEGPVWLPDGSVLVVEIRSGNLTRISKAGEKSTVAYVGGGPNGLAIGPDGAYYICNNGGFEWHDHPDGRQTPGLQAQGYISGSIQRVDPQTGEVRVLYDKCGPHALRGPNDIVFDAHGAFWFTDLGKRRDRSMDHGGVYYAWPDGSKIVEVIYPMNTPNGIGLSPGGDRLYVAETSPGRLWAFDIAGPGSVHQAVTDRPHGGELLAGLPGFQLFDSLAVQDSGHICVATLFNGGITVVSPDGQSIEHVPLPDPFTTNICFGGAELREAFVTLSSTGQLVRVTWPRPGLRLNADRKACQ